jgi:hypothetical protein
MIFSNDRAYAIALKQDPADARAWAQRGYIALLSNRFAAAERIGAVEIANVPVMWDDVSFTAAPGDGEPVGVIGTTIFYHFQTTMDYAGRALTLRRAAAAPAPSLVTAPLWLAPDHFIFSWGRVGESGPGPVLIDTGGVGLGAVLSTAQATAGQVVPDYANPESDLGVTCYPCTAEVALGQVRRGVPGVVGPFTSTDGFGFNATGTLSHEFFKPSSITFDFRAMTVTMPAGPLAKQQAAPAR